MSTPEQLVIAKLNGEASRLSANGVGDEEGVRRLQALSDDPVLLGRVAGAFLAQVRVQPEISPWAPRALRLLALAGADREVAEAAAVEVAAVLRRPPHSTP